MEQQTPNEDPAGKEGESKCTLSNEGVSSIKQSLEIVVFSVHLLGTNHVKDEVGQRQHLMSKQAAMLWFSCDGIPSTTEQLAHVIMTHQNIGS